MKQLLPILLCSSLTLLAPCGHPGGEPAQFDPGAEAQLRVRGGGFSHVHVWAELNGEVAGWFLLDSGAEGNRLNKSVAERLGIELRRMGTVSGIGWSAPAFDARADTLEVGPMTMKSPRFVVAGVENDREGDLLGTLGSDVFEQAIIVYDHARPSVALYDPAAYQAPPVEWEECVLLEDRPFAKMSVEGQEVLLEIDTGGGEGILLCTPAVDRLGLSEREGRDGSISGRFGGVPVRNVMLDSFQIGAHRLDRMPATLGVEHDGWLGSTEHDGLIGGPVLSHMVVIFDYGRERLSFTDRRLFPLLTGAPGQVGTPSYSPSQATGEPDAVDKDSYGKAWFPADSHGKHWLELTYATAIQPQRLEIWGTYSQLGVTSISATTKSGSTKEIEWSGEVEKTLDDGLALTAAHVTVGEPVVKIRLDLDCSSFEGTNVVDAVGLVDAAGTTHWAQTASADGSLHGSDQPELDAREALEQHATRLQQRGQDEEAALVRLRARQVRNTTTRARKSE